jgi:hypothetical protein
MHIHSIIKSFKRFFVKIIVVANFGLFVYLLQTAKNEKRY